MGVDLEPDTAEEEIRAANEDEDTKPAVILTEVIQQEEAMRVDLEPDAAEEESRAANEEEDTKPAVILTLRSLYTKFEEKERRANKRLAEAWDVYRATMDEARKDFAKAEVLLDREIEERKRRRTTSSVDAVSAESKMSDDEAKEKRKRRRKGNCRTRLFSISMRNV